MASMIKNLKNVNWGMTLLLNLERSIAAGITLFVISLFLEGGANPLLLLHPLGFFPIILPMGLFAFLLTKAKVPFAGIIQIFISLTIAIGDPLVYLIHKIVPDLIPIDKYGFFNFEILLYVENPPKPSKPDTYHVNPSQVLERVGDATIYPMPSKPVADELIIAANYYVPKNHNLFDFNKKVLWTSLEAHISSQNNREQIKILENALSQNNTLFEEFILRSLLMSNLAILKNLEAANIEAVKARKIFENNDESWMATIDYVNFPAESLFINNLHFVPIYPDSIRPDMDENSRKNAAIDMMAQYYEVFVTFSVVHILLYAYYLHSGDRERSGLELTTGTNGFTADTQLCSPIFHTMLGLHYKEKGDYALSSNELNTALTDNIRARELFSLFEDESHKSFIDNIKYALNIWEVKAKSTSNELDKIIPKRKNSLKTLLGVIFIVGLCFVAYELFRSKSISDSAPIKEIPDTVESSQAKVSNDMPGYLSPAAILQINKLKEEINELQIVLEGLERRSPSKEEVTDIIKKIKQIAYESHLDITKLTFESEVDDGFCYEWPTLIEIAGNYDNLHSFFDKMSKFEKIINIDDISIKPETAQGNDKILITTFMLKMYFFLNESKQSLVKYEENKDEVDQLSKFSRSLLDESIFHKKILEKKLDLIKKQEEKQKEILKSFKNTIDSKDQEMAFLKENAKKPGVKVTASGLQYKVITEGSGPLPKESETVKFHSRVTMIDGTEIENTYKRNEPIVSPLNHVLKGLIEALQLMKVGSKWQVFLPSSLAFGESGKFGDKQIVGSNATVIYEVELLGIISNLVNDNIATMERKIMTAWGEIENAYNRRADIISKLVEAIEGKSNANEAYEAVIKTLMRVKQIQSNEKLVNDPDAFNNFAKAQNDLGVAVGALLISVEKQPAITSSQIFRDIQMQLEGVGDRIMVERLRYNEAAQEFNSAISILSISGKKFSEKPYFKSE